MYYTKEGKPTLYPQTEADRFAVWVQNVRARIPEPSVPELARVRATPCRYLEIARRIAHASRN
jgi:hypothetical protein